MHACEAWGGGGGGGAWADSIKGDIEEVKFLSSNKLEKL